MKVVRKADVVIVNFDISGFHAKALLGAVLHLMYFETDGVDAAGNELHTVRTRTICCNTLPVADKISVDFAREDGTLFAKEVPTRMLEPWRRWLCPEICGKSSLHFLWDG